MTVFRRTLAAVAAVGFLSLHNNPAFSEGSETSSAAVAAGNEETGAFLEALQFVFEEDLRDPTWEWHFDFVDLSQIDIHDMGWVQRVPLTTSTFSWSVMETNLEDSALRQAIGFGWSDLRSYFEFVSPTGTVAGVSLDPVAADLARIGAALKNQGYESAALNGGQAAWCQPPVAIGEDRESFANFLYVDDTEERPCVTLYNSSLLWSGSKELLNLTLSGLANSSSQASNPMLQFAVEDLYSLGRVVQARLTQTAYPHADLARYLLGENVLPETKAVFDREIRKYDEVALPFFKYAIIADVDTGEDNRAVVALVYDDPNTAEAAAARMSGMMDKPALLTERPYAQELIYPYDTAVTTSDNGFAMAALHLVQPPETKAGDAFAHLLRLYDTMNFPFLWVDPSFEFQVSEEFRRDPFKAMEKYSQWRRLTIPFTTVSFFAGIPQVSFVETPPQTQRGASAYKDLMKDPLAILSDPNALQALGQNLPWTITCQFSPDEMAGLSSLQKDERHPVSVKLNTFQAPLLIFDCRL